MEIKRFRGEEFERLVHTIFMAAGATETRSHTMNDFGVDFSARILGRPFLVEVRYFRSESAEVRALQQAALILEGVVERVNGGADEEWGGILVVSSRVSGAFADSLRARGGLAIVDGEALTALCVRYAPAFLEYLSMALPYEVNTAEITAAPTLAELVDADVHMTLAVEAEAPVPMELDEGASLCKDLKSIPCGKTHAKKYEVQVQKILEFLFRGQLEGFRAQSRTTDRMSVMDIICRVRRNDGFWHFVATERASRYVLFECKNYCEHIGQDQVLSTEKYLMLGANRGVGFIISRKVASAQALRMTEGALREQGKLVLTLCDDDLCKMLDSADRGEDPSDYLFELADEFLMRVGR